MKHMLPEFFLKMFPEDARDSLARNLYAPGVRGFVLLENVTKGAPSFGRQAVASYGPGCAHKTITDIADRWHGVAETDRLQPIAWCIRDDVEIIDLAAQA